MDKTLTLNLSEKLAREGARRFLLSQFDWKFLAAMLVIAGYVSYSVVSNRINFLAGVGCAILVIGIATFIVGYVRLQSGALETIRRRRGEPARFTFGEWGFCIESKVGLLRLGWNDVAMFRKYKSMVLLAFNTGGYVVIPIEDLLASDYSHLEGLVASGKRANA